MEKMDIIKEEDDFIIDSIEVSSTEQLKEILSFISKSFNHRNDKSSNIRNYRLFIEFLNAKGYTINELDADILLSKSSSLKSMIKTIIDLDISPNELVDALINVYKLEEDNNLEESFISKDQKDIDLINLYYDEIKKFRVLTREEEKELFERYQKGDMFAFEKLVNHNLRLVVKASKRLLGLGIPFLDIIQEGNIALIKTIKKFDVNQGYKFSTYFMSRVKWLVERRAKKTNRIITLPIYYYDDLLKLKRVMEQNLEILDNLNEKEKNQFLAKITGFTIEKIQDLKAHLLDADSYDKIINSQESHESANNEDTYSYFLTDRECCVEDSALDNVNFTEMLNFLNNTQILTEDEKKVIYYRYVHSMSLKAIGKIMNVRDETIRQREKRALRKLRNSKEFREFVSQEYLDAKNLTFRKRKYNTVK